MKPGIFIGIIILLVWACSPVKEASKTSASLTQKSQDTTEYEIQIIDPHFEQWYLLNFDPSKDHSNDFYRSKNLTAVETWNNYYRTGQYGQFIDSPIEYWPNIDYGIEVNRKLFWYFKYIKDYYGIRLFR